MVIIKEETRNDPCVADTLNATEIRAWKEWRAMGKNGILEPKRNKEADELRIVVGKMRDSLLQTTRELNNMINVIKGAMDVIAEPEDNPFYWPETIARDTKNFNLDEWRLRLAQLRMMPFQSKDLKQAQKRLETAIKLLSSIRDSFIIHIRNPNGNKNESMCGITVGDGKGCIDDKLSDEITCMECRAAIQRIQQMITVERGEN